MNVCARAPVRVDPAGGGTDAPPYCFDHGGAVVNFAVRRYAFASVHRLAPGSGVVIYAADLGEGVAVDNVEQLTGEPRLEFLSAFLLRLMRSNDSLLLITETDVPPGSGLGGSGALGVAIVAAIDGAYERARTCVETARLANEIERKDLGYPGGDQDSYGAAFGGLNFLEYHEGGGMTPHRIQVTDEVSARLEHQSLMIYTGAAHVSSSIHEDIQRSYELPDSPTIAAMHVLRDQARRMAQALESSSIDDYASALSESCRQLYNLHPSCSSAEHRRYFAALDDCILGGKTCGAGGGGFLLVLTRPGFRGECIRRVRELEGLVWPLTFDHQGLTTWHRPPLGDEAVEHIRQSVLSTS